MALQIFGKSKCFDTKKAERFFKERGIRYQYIDIIRYGMSRGELKSVISAVGSDAIVNKLDRDYPLYQYLASEEAKLEKMASRRTGFKKHLAIFILVATIRLLHNNLKLVHDGYPSGVTKDDVELVIGNHKNVASVHRVHVWALNAHEYSMTAHFSLHDISKLEETKKELKDSLKNRLAIDHVTLELDAPEDWKKEDSNDKQ